MESPGTQRCSVAGILPPCLRQYLSCGNIAPPPWLRHLGNIPATLEISLTIDLDASHYLHNTVIISQSGHYAQLDRWCDNKMPPTSGGINYFVLLVHVSVVLLQWTESRWCWSVSTWHCTEDRALRTAPLSRPGNAILFIMKSYSSCLCFVHVEP